MAIQNTSYVKGTVGQIIFYEFRGKPVLRTKPSKVRQTKATKASAKEFGRAVRYSKEIRWELTPLVNVSDDRSLMYRMNSVLLKWLIQGKEDDNQLPKNIEGFDDFQLNE